MLDDDHLHQIMLSDPALKNLHSAEDVTDRVAWLEEQEQRRLWREQRQDRRKRSAFAWLGSP